MSTSREDSPDWLRSFQAPPTHSILTLSSESESSLDGVRPGEDKTDRQELSPQKSSKFPDEDENFSKNLGKSAAESPSRKRLKGNSPKKGKNAEDHIPLKKKKSDRLEEKEGDGKKISKEGKKPLKSHEVNDSVLTLASDSDPENSPPREDGINQGESSDHKMSQLQGRGKVEDAALLNRNEESPSKKASKGKSLKRSPKGDGQTPMKENKRNDSKEKEGMKWGSGVPQGHLGAKSNFQGPGQGSNLVSDNGSGNCGDVEVVEEEASNKHIEPHVSSASLPLVLSEKVHRSKALVECEGDSIDLSGDMGAVGRIVVSDTRSVDREMYLDLKGTIYKTTVVPSRTFCVVSFGQSEAKIEAIMNDFIQLKPQSNVYEAETMVEGTLDGFSFDSDDEADKFPKSIAQQTDQNEDADEQTNGTTKGKAEKASKVVRKRGKTAGTKPQPPKKARKKTQVSKKAKSKK